MHFDHDEFWDRLDAEEARLAALQPGEVATFADSGEAYDTCQTTLTADGIVLDCGDGVVGLSDTWPVAVTANRGKLHSLTCDPAEYLREGQRVFSDAAITVAVRLAVERGLALNAHFARFATAP